MKVLKEILSSLSKPKQAENIKDIDLRGLGCDALNIFLSTYMKINEGRYRVMLDNESCFIMIKRLLMLLNAKLIDFGRGNGYLYIIFSK